MHSNFNIAAPDRGWPLPGSKGDRPEDQTARRPRSNTRKNRQKIGLIQQRPKFGQPHLLVSPAIMVRRAGFPPIPGRDLADGRELPQSQRRDQRFARQNDIFLAIIDAGVAHDFGQRNGLIHAKVAPGTANYIEQAGDDGGSMRHRHQARGEISRNLAASLQSRRLRRNGDRQHAAAPLLTHCLTGRRWPPCVVRTRRRADDAGLARKRACWEQALAIPQRRRQR